VIVAGALPMSWAAVRPWCVGRLRALQAQQEHLAILGEEALQRLRLPRERQLAALYGLAGQLMRAAGMQRCRAACIDAKNAGRAVFPLSYSCRGESLKDLGDARLENMSLSSMSFQKG
jgi:hypothetical protein